MEDLEKAYDEYCEKEENLTKALVRVKYGKLGAILGKENLTSQDYVEASEVCKSLGTIIECAYDCLFDKEIDDALDNLFEDEDVEIEGELN